MTNQDVYYEAIEADINAVNDRLKGVRHMEGKKSSMRNTCVTPLQSDQTPYGHIEMCSVIKAQLQRLEVEIEQTGQKKLSPSL